MAGDEISVEFPPPFDADSFWSALSVAALAQEQSISPVTFDSPLLEMSDAERDDLMCALAELDT